MRNRTKLLLAGLTAALLLSIGITGASARNFSLSNEQFRVTWGSLHFTSASMSIECPVTLEGSFVDRTIAKVFNAQVGRMSAAAVRNEACTGGHITFDAEALPWRVNYNGFSGTLPNITSIQLNFINLKWTFENGSQTCTSNAGAREPAKAEVLIAGGRVTGLRADENSGILLRGEFLCELAGTGHFANTGTVVGLGTTASITVTLI
jgi:hypothetical protein